MLIAEDNAELCNTLAAYFRERDRGSTKYSWLPYIDGGGALDHLQEADVLITDLVMPNLDGFSLPGAGCGDGGNEARHHRNLRFRVGGRGAQSL